MNEKQFSEQVIDLAHLYGWRVAHFTQAQVGRGGAWVTPIKADGKGYPDLTLARERVIFAELKVGYNKPTEEQLQWMLWLTGAGAEHHLWYPKDLEQIQKTLFEVRLPTVNAATLGEA